MKGTPFQKLLLMMTLVAIAVALLLQAINTRFKPQPAAETPPRKITQSETKSAYTTSRPKTMPAVAEEDEVDGPAQPKIPRDKAEAWLAKHHRNAASLLTVFRAMGDTNYLHEAATNFPNDPQVQLAVLSRNAFPEDRRKWLDSFQASSPDNSLADYLSAADHFKNGKPDEAMQELIAASGKEQFQNYAIETLLNGEELYSDAGTPPRLTASHVMGGEHRHGAARAGASHAGRRHGGL